jgi:RNA polymerase sigma-70 factor, ECF subfamily
MDKKSRRELTGLVLDPGNSGTPERSCESCDDELAALAAKGDRGAFESLAWRWWDRLRGFCAALSAFDAELADDSAQDALIRLHKALPRWRKSGSFGAFAYGVCKNAVADASRRRARRNAKQFSLDSEPSFEIADTRATPEEDALRAELRAELASALSTLDLTDRALVYLHESEGTSVKDLAEMFRLPEGTVKSRLFRARKALASALKEAGYA